MKYKIIGSVMVLFLLLGLIFGNCPAQAVIKPIKAKTSIIKTKNIKTLDQALKAKVPIVVKLGSDSCYPCKMMKPVLAQLSVEQDGKIVFLDLDIYQNRALAKEFQVRVIPTLIYYDKQGKVKGKTEGGMTKEQLLKTIKDLKL